MESTRQSAEEDQEIVIGSESSSNDVIIQPEKVNVEGDDGDSLGTGRSYECKFCKRGFTNAQALGGHMNIHRKEKAKAKAKQKKVMITTLDHHQSPKFEITQTDSIISPAPAPNLGTQTKNPYNQASAHPELAAPNLSLRIGPPSEEGEEDGTHVDLELRLGHSR